MDYTKCESVSDFDTKNRDILGRLDVTEGEETWQQIDNALKDLLALVKAGAPKLDTFVTKIRNGAAKFICSAVISERTRLSGTAVALVEELSRQLELDFQPLSEQLFPAVMKTCGRANKVFVTRGVACLTNVITYSHAPEQTARVCEASMKDTNKVVRTSAAKLLMALVSCCTTPELAPHLDMVEKAIAAGVIDANPEARTVTRQTYEIYVKRFSDRVESLNAGLSGTARKYLKIDAPSAEGSRAARKRIPLRERIMAQRKGGGGHQEAAGQVQAGQRPKPVRPVARAVQTAAAAAVKSAEVQGDEAKPAIVHLGDEKPAQGARAHSPLMGTKTTIEQVVAAATQIKAAGLQPPKEPESEAVLTKVKNDTEAGASAATSATCASRPPSKQSSPALESVSEQTAGARPNTPSEDSQGAAERPRSRAQRPAGGLTFSSLRAGKNGGGARRPQPVRAPSRNIVVSRVEAAMRARPRTAEREPGRRMTLRSDTSRAGSASEPDLPGYLRATAASSKRTEEIAEKARMAKRRRPEEPSEPQVQPQKAKRVVNKAKRLGS